MFAQAMRCQTVHTYIYICTYMNVRMSACVICVALFGWKILRLGATCQESVQSFKTWCNTSRVGATCYRGSQDIQEIQVYVRTYVYEHSEFHVIGELAGSLKSIIIIHIKQPQIFVSKLKQGDNEQEAFEILLHSKNKKKAFEILR